MPPRPPPRRVIEGVMEGVPEAQSRAGWAVDAGKGFSGRTPHTSWATEGRGALTPPAPVDVALGSQFDFNPF